MTENIRKIFDMFGVEPNERFKLDNSKYCYTYYIDENLIIRTDGTNSPSICNVLDIITENVKIIKIPKYEFTKEENDALKGLKLLKFNYIARNETGELLAYTDKPEKNYTLSVWQYQFGEITYVNPNMFKSIKWKDSEPFEISDFKDEPEYETDEKKIKDRLKNILKDTNNLCMLLDCRECSYSSKNNGNKDSDIKCSLKLFMDELIGNNFTFLKSEE